MASRTFEAAIDHLKSLGVKFEDGLSKKEIARIEGEFQFRFPVDLKRFLQTALPITAGFPNWRSESANDLRNSYFDRPSRGILFDVEYNDFWSSEWGPRPAELEEALVEAKRHLETIPRLIPIRSHHYLPAFPSVEDNPVLSVRQTDITCIGRDLPSYLLNLFKTTKSKHESDPSHLIPFWTDALRSNRIRVPNLAGPGAVDTEQAYDQLCQIARDAGFWAEVVPNFQGVTFDHSEPTGDRKQGVFWITRRDFGWLICVRCPRYYFAPNADRIPELCLALLEGLPHEELQSGQHLPFWNFHLNDGLRREFGLVAIQHFTQMDDEREKKLRHWEQFGWREMSRGQSDKTWNAYEERFYDNAVGQFKTSKPSVMWSIVQVYLRGKEFREKAETDLTAKALAAFQKLTRPGEELFALDLNHPCYFFDPHAMFESSLNDWPVPVLPDGDHYIFLARDYRFGIIGNCVDMTICVFGKELLAAFEISRPIAFQWPTWTAEVRRANEERWTDLGWQKLTFDEKEEIWERFDSQFHFDQSRFSTDNSVIEEPTPSVTWALKPDGALAENEILAETILRALKQSTKSGERLYAFLPPRWYEYYTFNPHRLESASSDSWAVTVNTNEGVAIYVAQDLRFGVFVNPVERTICIFGEEMLAGIDNLSLSKIGKKIRRNGIAVAD